MHVIDHLYQILQTDSTLLTGLSADRATAPVGVNPECGIPLVKTNGSLGNIANIITCGLSAIVVVALIVFCSRRKAAVGTFSVLVHFSDKALYPCGRVCHSVFRVGPFCATHVSFSRSLRASHIPWRIPPDTDIPVTHEWVLHTTRHQRPGHYHCDSCCPYCYSFLDLTRQCYSGDTARRRRYTQLSDSALPLVSSLISNVNVISNSLLASLAFFSLLQQHTYPSISHCCSTMALDLQTRRNRSIVYLSSC